MAEPTDGLKIPVHVQTTGDAGKKAAEGIKEVRAETEKAAPVIRDYADAEKDAAAATEKRVAAEEKFAATQKKWQEKGNKGGSGLASDPASFNAGEGAAADAAAIAAEERRASIQAQRLILVDMETEAVEKQAAGHTVAAAQLRADMAVRQRALQLQIQTGMSEDEAMATAARQLVAERQITAQQAEQLALTKAQAAARAQQTAAARAQATDGRLAGDKGKFGAVAENLGMGASTAMNVGVAAMAMQQLASFAHETAKGFDEARIASQGHALEMQKQSAAWTQMAAMAQSMDDVTKLQGEMHAKLVQAEEQLRLMPQVADGFFTAMVDGFKVVHRTTQEWLGDFGAIAPAAMHNLSTVLTLFTGVETSVEKAKTKQEEYIQRLYLTEKATVAAAKRSAEEWKALEQLTPDEQVAKLSAEISRLTEEQKGLNQETTGGQAVYLRLQEKIQQASKAMEHAQKLREAEAEASRKLGEDLQAAEEKRMSLIERKNALVERSIDLQGQLEIMLGEAAASPKDAFDGAEAAGNQAIAVRQLAVEWAKVRSQIEDATKAISKQEENEQKAAERKAEERAKEGAELEKQMAAEVKIHETRKDALEVARAEQALLAAEATGNKAVTKEMEIQLQYEKQIDALKSKGLTQQEAEAEARKTKELRAQVAEKEKETKLSEMRAEQETKAAEQGRSRQRKVDAQVTEARLKKEHEAIAAGATPEEARKLADDEGELLRRKLQKESGRVDGRARRSSRDNIGDGLTEESEWEKKFGKKDGPQNPAMPEVTPVNPAKPPEVFGPEKPPETFGPEAPPEQFGPPAPEGEGAAAVKEGGEAAKEAATQILEGGAAMREAGATLQEAGAGAQEVAGAMREAASTIVAGYAEIKGEIAELKQQIANMRSYS